VFVDSSIQSGNRFTLSIEEEDFKVKPALPTHFQERTRLTARRIISKSVRPRTDHTLDFSAETGEVSQQEDANPVTSCRNPRRSVDFQST
jgi:hypothetical protein